MLCHVALVRTDVSEELSSSIIRVSRIGELGTMLAITSTDICHPDDEGSNSSEMSVLTRVIQPIPEDAILHSQCRENLKSYIVHWLVCRLDPEALNSGNSRHFPYSLHSIQMALASIRHPTPE
jgi:hypothetical protein